VSPPNEESRPLDKDGSPSSEATNAKDTSPSILSLPIAIGEFEARDNIHWNPSEVDWDKFCRHPVKYARDKHAVASYVFGTIVQTERKDCEGKDCSGFHRNGLSVVSRIAITIDADFLVEEGDGDGEKLLARLADLGLAAFVYETYSSKPGHIRLRIVIPLDTAVDRTTYRAITRHVMRELGWDGTITTWTDDEGHTRSRFGVFDQGSQQHERLMYLQARPIASKGGEPPFRQKFDGPFLDTEDWFLTAACEEPESVQKPVERPKADLTGAATPEEVEAAEAALDEAVEALRATPGGPGGGAHATFMRVVPDLYRYASAGCLDWDSVTEQVVAVCEEKGHDMGAVLGNRLPSAQGYGQDDPRRPRVGVKPEDLFKPIDDDNPESETEEREEQCAWVYKSGNRCTMDRLPFDTNTELQPNYCDNHDKKHIERANGGLKPDRYPQPSDENPAAALANAHSVFRKWLGEDYDIGSLNATLAAAAVLKIGGDPLWLLIISGPGYTKTETVQALSGAGAYVESTVTGEAALLSGSGRADRAKDATGGLLRKIGGEGILVLKDVTSILSMSRDPRAQVFGAFREIFDGMWSRNIGSDGGKTLIWRGRLVMVGAVTSAWDNHHAAIATMGDRFILCRTDSKNGHNRLAAGRQAMRNIGSEVEMKKELTEAVTRVCAAASRDNIPLTDEELEAILAASNLVTLARTNVEVDYQGNPISADAPEAPTRMAKQLAQVVRGGVAIGMPRDEALALAIRCARDSIPPTRRKIINDLAAFQMVGAEHEEEDQNGDPVNFGEFSTVSAVQKRTGLTRRTADRALQSLLLLEVLEQDSREVTYRKEIVSRWAYRIAEGIDPAAIGLPE